jgi:hypothetical protein
MTDRPSERRKDELVAKIRERRARLDRTLASLDDRVAVIAATKDRVVRVGRLTAIAVGVVAVTLTAAFLIRALVRPRGRRR